MIRACGFVLQGQEKVLDNPVTRKIQTGREHTTVTPNLQAGVRQVGLAEETIELRQNRLRFGGRLSRKVATTSRMCGQRLPTGHLY